MADLCVEAVATNVQELWKVSCVSRWLASPSINGLCIVIFEVPTVTALQIAVIWGVTPCRFVEV